MPKKPKEELTAGRHQMVAQHNEFIRHPKNKLTAQEQNIVYFLFSKVKPNDKDFMRVHFTAEEFCEICGMNTESGKNWSDIKAALVSLANKSAWATGIDEHGKYETLVRWVDTYKIYQDSGKMEAVLSQSIKPFLIGLIEKGNYTQAELVGFLAMKSVYSKRLYELLKSYVKNKYPEMLSPTKKEFELEELKNLVNATDYKEFKNLKQRVLDPSMNEINSVGDIFVSYETAKRNGRAVSHVIFTVQAKDSVERCKAWAEAEKALDGAK